MKTFALCVISALVLCGCASSPSTQRTGGADPPQKKVAEEDKSPFIGMTKEQALARYGEPKQRTVTEEGEQWTYILNFGEFVGKHLIPFFVSTEQIRTGVLIFGSDGTVKKFRWDTSES